MRKRQEVQEVLRYYLTFIVTVLLVGSAALAGPIEDVDSGNVDTGGVVDLETRNLVEVPLIRRDGWFARGISALITRKDPAADASAGSRTQLARDRFLLYTGLGIHRIHIIGRTAFGTVVPDSTLSVMEEPADSLITRASAVERLLNSAAAGTRDAVIRNFLLFDEGDVLDPFLIADSERLLRRQTYIRDARIEVIPRPDRPGQVDVIVLVRDRWPWGVNADVQSADRYDIAFYHRNIGGLGWNLEAQLFYERNRSPETGWRLRTSATNLAGSFIDVAVVNRDTWDLERTVVTADRDFTFPDLRLVGGGELRSTTDRNHDLLPEGVALRSRVRGAWVGWGFRLREADQLGHRRLRLVPSVGVTHLDYQDPPRWYGDQNDWRDHTRYLGQLTLSGFDYYTTSLVYGYGETEDLPSGLWTAVVGGWEHGELEDRFYHGVRAIWPRFLSGHRYLTVDASCGGFRRNGRFEDGLLDLRVSGISPLRRHGYGHWRHFFQVRYTLGINQDDRDGLRLDTAVLRDLDNELLAGNQRLVAGGESVLFTPYAIFGFKVAAFGYGSGGFISKRKDAVFEQRLHTDVGVGLRLHNPNLVIPTVELRVAVVHSDDHWDPTVTLRMGEIKFLSRDLPGAKPSILPYR